MSLFGNVNQKRRLNQLIDSWIQYRDMVTRHSDAAASPEQENQFLRLKASISARLPILSDSHGSGGVNQELNNHVRGMTDLMNSQLALSVDGDKPGVAREDFLSRWHTHFLYLNRFKGLQKQAKPARRHGKPAPISGSPGNFRNPLSGFFNNWFTRFVVRVAVLAAVVIFGAKLLDIDFRQAPDWGRRVYAEWWGGETTSSETGIASEADRASLNATAAKKSGDKKANDGTVRINAGRNSSRYKVDGGSFVPPLGSNPMRRAINKAGQFVPRPVKSFFQPVAQFWGVEATVALVGIGLLLVAYMIFGRAR